MNYQGKITHILPLEHVGASQLPKRTIILEEITDKERKGGIAIDFFKEKTDLINDLSVGDTVDCAINVKVNEYKGKWYNSITCWKVDKKSSQEGNSSATGAEEPFIPNSYDDELPF